MDPSIIVVLIYLVVPLLFLAAIYWVVRLGVRDGMHDATRDRRSPPAPQG